MSSVAPRDIVRIGKMALADHIDQLVSHRPGMTELALAKSLFGRVGYQQRVNSTCRRLFREGHPEQAWDRRSRPPVHLLPRFSISFDHIARWSENLTFQRG